LFDRVIFDAVDVDAVGEAVETKETRSVMI
jgi:hypothetical protein